VHLVQNKQTELILQRHYSLTAHFSPLIFNSYEEYAP